MILTIVFILIVIAVGIYMTWDELPGFLGWILGIFLTLLAAALVGVLCLGICASLSDCMPERTMQIELTYTTEIIALKDNQNMNGHFYLMGGYVNEDLYYYYAENTQYGYKTNKVKASDCYVVYSDDQPKIETYSGERFNHWWYYIYAMPYHRHYVIYVPDGTVTTEFNIDLE